MRRAGHGFTLIEALVSLGVGALCILLAAQLLRDSQLALLGARRQALDPMPGHLAQLLRSDVHRATGTVRLRGSAGQLWERGALTLALPDGGRVRYEKVAGEVRRRLLDAAGVPLGERPLLRGVVSWRWLQLSSDLVEVEIGYRRRPAGEALRPSLGVERSSIATLRVRLAMRARPGRSSW